MTKYNCYTTGCDNTYEGNGNGYCEKCNKRMNEVMLRLTKKKSKGEEK